MAFGLPASYETEIEVTASHSVVRDAIERTFELFCWNHSVNESRSVVVARVPGGLVSWGEEFVVSLVDEPVMRITSTCRLWQMFDWGKNRKNVDRFTELFLSEVDYFTTLDGPSPIYLDDGGQTPVERLITDTLGDQEFETLPDRPMNQEEL